MTKDGSNARKKRIRAYMERTGVPNREAAQASTAKTPGGRTSTPGFALHSTLQRTLQKSASSTLRTCSRRVATFPNP